MSTNEIEELCRLCGSEEGIKVNIFEPDSDHVKKIHRILPISVNEHDSLPKTMCHRCSFKVNDFYEFRIKCIRAQDLFKSKLPWLKEKTNMTCPGDNEHPPMVELPLNSINFVSPSEKLVAETNFVDENDPLIVIDDSPPYDDKSTSLHENHNPQEKIIMKIKRSELKKRSKSKSIWDTKKRRRRTYNSCRITEVFTTTLDSFENIGDVNSDPLGITITEADENISNNKIVVNQSEQSKEKLTKDDIKLPQYILVTNIPRVGCVYTCEKCGRTFLSPQPASLHTCHDDVGTIEIDGSKDQDNATSPNHVTDYYSCNECNQIFSRQSQLMAHKKKHFEVVSSSDESVKTVNRRKKHRKHNRVKSHPLEIPHILPNTVITENRIIRHSLLSSDSD